MQSGRRNCKHFVVILLIVVMSSVSLQAPVTAEPAFISGMALTGLSSEINNPKDLVKFMKKNFTFTEDPDLFGQVDYWQSPEEFLKKRAGDCEDYALFSQHMLKQLGLESHVISFYGKNGFAHTITVFKDKGVYNVINEDRLYKYKAKSLEEALSRVNPYWTWGAFAEIRGKRGWMLRLILNPAFQK